jgi:light-regulated signal transduction histidine kinase (bacteriophytochrome)
MLVEPLYFREDQLGFILFEVGEQTPSICEVIRRQISSALKGALLLQEREQAKQELARSNKELEQFAYVASHDLQEPLRMVRSYLQLLQRRYQSHLDEDADEFIAFAVDGASRMHALINGLLTYSRVNMQGKSFRATDSGQVLQRVLGDLKIAIDEAGVVVTHHNDFPIVMADEVQLAQLFQNLIGNAIKFHGNLLPEIRIEVKRHSDRAWVFSINDNGIGIEPRYYKRIFMIFQRLHTQTEYEGTGIGLAICKKIVERHGGRIWVESEPGQGSTFYFTISEGQSNREVR